MFSYIYYYMLILVDSCYNLCVCVCVCVDIWVAVLAWERGMIIIGWQFSGGEGAGYLGGSFSRGRGSENIWVAVSAGGGLCV